MFWKKIDNLIANNSFVFWMLIISGLLVYINALAGKIFWDAEYEILQNSYIKDWNYIGHYFTESLASGSGRSGEYWRPMLLLLYSLEWHLWNSWDAGFHFVNIFIHIANSIFIFILLDKILQNRYPSVTLAFIFLLHPIQTESVTYITGIADPLSIFFMTLATLFLVRSIDHINRSEKNKLALLSYLSFIFSLMTKEIAIIYPGIAISILVYIYLKKGTKIRDIIKVVFRKTWQFVLISMVYLLLRSTIFNFGNLLNLYSEKNEYTESILIRTYTFLSTLPTYIKLLIYPQNLHMEYDLTFSSALNSSVILGIFIFIFSLFLFFVFFRKKPEISLGITIFYLPLLPVSGIFIPANGLFYEHWLYLPLIGFFMFLYFLLQYIFKAVGKNSKFIIFSFIVIYLLFLGIGTIKRNFDYINPETFYNNILIYNPKSLRVWNNLGMVYADYGEYEKSIMAYQKALSLDINSQSWPPHHNLANNYKALGKKDEAIKEYEIAIKIAVTSLPPYIGLADLYYLHNDYENAIATLKRAENLFPQNLEIKQYIKTMETKNINAKQ